MYGVVTIDSLSVEVIVVVVVVVVICFVDDVEV